MVWRISRYFIYIGSRIWFIILIHITHLRWKEEDRDVNKAAAVSASIYSAENFLAAGYYSPWGLHPLCLVVWGKKKKVISLDKTTALLCQVPQSEPGMKSSMELTDTATGIGLDSSLTLSGGVLEVTSPEIIVDSPPLEILKTWQDVLISLL